MTNDNEVEQKSGEGDRRALGDARPYNTDIDPRTGGSLPQEKVEDRKNVSSVTPEDYPAEDRKISQPK